MAREKDRSGARPGEALCEEQEREYGGLSASVEVGNWYSEISVQMLSPLGETLNGGCGFD